MSNLSISDYKNILKFYNISYRKKSNYKIKKLAENILAIKFCRCIKTVSRRSKDKSERRAIAICANSVFTKKKLKYNRFTCKSNPKLIPNKKTRKNLTKHS